MYYNDEQDNRSNLLPLIEFAYNNSEYSATSMSPFFTLCRFYPTIRFEAKDSLYKGGYKL